MNIIKLNKENTVLVLIDIQERLLPAMDEMERSLLEDRNLVLTKGCKVLNVPILVTQQYTKGLGPTIPSLREALGEFTPVEKTAFSAGREPSFMEALEALGKKIVILTGIEAHVCVMQTALDLMEKGYTVFLPVDCIGSRKPMDKKFAAKRMASAGAQLATCESVLFELCGGAREPGFKEISALVK